MFDYETLIEIDEFDLFLEKYNKDSDIQQNPGCCDKVLESFKSIQQTNLYSKKPQIKTESKIWYSYKENPLTGNIEYIIESSNK